MESESQRRWMWANKPEMARKWEAVTPKGRLPERVKKGAAEFAAFVEEVQKLADLDKMRLAPAPKLKPAVAAPPNPEFRIKQGQFAVSQYSGPLGYGGFPQASMIPAWHEEPLRKEKSAGPPPEEPSRLESSGDKPVPSGREGSLKNAAAALTPAGIFAKARTVGAPKLKAPGPSIAQQSKPVGFGTPLPGLTKRALIERLVRLGATDVPGTPRLFMRHRGPAELKGLQDKVEHAWDSRVTNPLMGKLNPLINRLPAGKLQSGARAGARLVAEDPVGTLAANLVPVLGAHPAYVAGKKGIERLIDRVAPLPAAA